MQFNNQPVIKDNQASIVFGKLDLAAYQDFINVRTLAKYQIKDRTAIFPASYIDDFWQENKNLPLPLTDGLFDYQKVMVQVGFIKQRYAFFADAGLGKTLIFGELIRQLHSFTDGRIVVCVPLNILSQFEEMCKDFFDDFPAFDHLHNSKMSLHEWCHYGDNRVAFINHEYFIRHDTPLKNVDVFLNDESSNLKGGIDGNGKIAKNIIAVTKGIKYKYAASATPSPNDRREYAMHALHLEDVKSEKEFISLFFVNKDGEYVLRKHSHEAFYKRLALWSIFIRNPKSYGFKDNLAGLKPWKEIHKRVEITPEQSKAIVEHASKGIQQALPGLPIKPRNMKQRGKFSQISKGFIYNDDGSVTLVKSNKPKAIVDIVESHFPEQVIIWTVFDTEGDIIEAELEKSHIKVAHITGKTKMDRRVELIEQFRSGDLKVIISKPRILGFGLNFQHCRIAIYSGLRDSYEQYYQSAKRIHRYGQDKQVLIYHVYTEYEQVILSNVLKKKEIVDHDFAYQEKMYIDSLVDELKEFLTIKDYKPIVKERIMFEPTITDNYTMYHNDSLKMMLEIAEGNRAYDGLYKNSVDLSVFSPPFMGDLFTYSDDPADMGNTRGLGAKGGLDEFMLQYRFFLKGMMHVTKPGRFMAMHLENVPLRKGLDGYIGVYPFVNKAIDAAMDEGWIMFGDPITILKNQQMQGTVKHVSSLSMSNATIDRSRIVPAMNGYLLIFKKPGENKRPIADLAKCNNCEWQGYANQLNGYDLEYAKREYETKINHYQMLACPNCNDFNIDFNIEMDGSKWIMHAEGAWPENGFNPDNWDDWTNISNIKQDERWQNLLYTLLGIWPDISESDILYRGNKNSNDTDKHLCPLPRSIIRRAIELYSLPGETVFTPFAGSGTTIDQAIRLNRKVIGAELKSEYFTLTIKNAELAVSESQQISLWDFVNLEV